jgi:hypothetical protein
MGQSRMQRCRPAAALETRHSCCATQLQSYHEIMKIAGCDASPGARCHRIRMIVTLHQDNKGLWF